MGVIRNGSRWVPSWISGLDMAVWITGPDGNISFINQQAEELLGLAASDCVGVPCYRVIGGVDASGRPLCRPKCPVLCQAQDNRGIKPTQLKIAGPDDNGHWIRIMTLPVTAPDRTGPWLVHCAHSVDRAHRVEEYLTRVAARTLGTETGTQESNATAISGREKEILSLLAEDENARSIAARLHLSHATVRNHVQHIMTKLDAHSTMEAVARYLLERE